MAFLVSGCLQGHEGASASGGDDGLHQTELAAGKVVVVPPQGYCIQRSTLRQSKTGGFALLASCESLTGQISGYAVDPMILTVSAVLRKSQGPEPDAEEIAAALGDGTVLRRLNGDGLTVVRVKATESLSDQSDPIHWRGMMVVNDTIVGLALYGPKGGAVTREKGLATLLWQAERIREDSPDVSQVSPAVPTAVQKTGSKGLKNILPGLFHGETVGKKYRSN